MRRRTDGLTTSINERTLSVGSFPYAKVVARRRLLRTLVLSCSLTLMVVPLGLHAQAAEQAPPASAPSIEYPFGNPAELSRIRMGLQGPIPKGAAQRRWNTLLTDGEATRFDQMIATFDAIRPKVEDFVDRHVTSISGSVPIENVNRPSVNVYGLPSAEPSVVEFARSIGVPVSFSSVQMSRADWNEMEFSVIGPRAENFPAVTPSGDGRVLVDALTALGLRVEMFGRSSADDFAILNVVANDGNELQSAELTNLEMSLQGLRLGKAVIGQQIRLESARVVKKQATSE